MRDRSATDRRYAIEWYHTNENRYRSAKEATGPSMSGGDSERDAGSRYDKAAACIGSI